MGAPLTIPSQEKEWPIDSFSRSLSGKINDVWDSLRRIPDFITKLQEPSPDSAQPARNVPPSGEHPALEAFKDGTLGFGFSGGGFLFPYFLGVAKELYRQGIMKEDSHMAGSSAGAIIAVSLKCGLTVPSLVKDAFYLAKDCRDNGTNGRLCDSLKAVLHKALPHDAHIRCSGTTHVGLSYARPLLEFEDVSYFYSKDDVIDALLASSYIPLYSGSTLTTSFRGRTVADGGLTNMLPTPKPCRYAVRISCLPFGVVQQVAMFKNAGLEDDEVDISPDLREPWPLSLSDTIKTAMHPSEEKFLQSLIECGEKDAAAWALSVGITQFIQSTQQSSLDQDRHIDQGSRGPLLEE